MGVEVEATARKKLQKSTNSPTQAVRVAQFSPQRLAKIYKTRAINAYTKGHIFTVHGQCEGIRKALLQRGWIEKLSSGRYPQLKCTAELTLLQKAKNGNEYEAVFLSKLVSDYAANFIWQPKGYFERYNHLMPYRNHVRRKNLDFTTKVGLIGCTKQEPLLTLCNVCGMCYPRCYHLRNTKEMTEFINDYRRTQCCNLLRFVVENVLNLSTLADKDKGMISPFKVLNYAINYIERGRLSNWEYADLGLKECSRTNDYNFNDWFEFLLNSNKIIMGEEKFRVEQQQLLAFASMASVYLQTIEERYTDYKWDGVRNLWILKPGYKARGEGIVLKKLLNEIELWSTHNYESSYVVQKYIERPLLIFDCKFDIRQYMLLTVSKSHVSIWLYKDCYLRFCSAPFSVDNLNESIHLTNNSIQRRYKVHENRDPRLPANNMWTLEQFKQYLRWINVPDSVWTEQIYAGFQRSLVAIALASFNETQFVENTFELYGCDFILDEHFHPILIEINSSPDISPTTAVTAMICPLVLEDLVKVVVDLPKDPCASTGAFEIAHQVNYRMFEIDKQRRTPVKAMEEKCHKEKLAKQQFYKKLLQLRLNLKNILNNLMDSMERKEGL